MKIQFNNEDNTKNIVGLTDEELGHLFFCVSNASTESLSVKNRERSKQLYLELVEKNRNVEFI